MEPVVPFDIGLRVEFVRPVYLKLLHGNFTRLDDIEGSGFRKAVTDAARTITDQQIIRLLDEREWRGRLSAGWFVGLTGRTQFIQTIGRLLLASELVYAGEGYCVALGLIGNDECNSLLSAYLNEYLPLKGRAYNQDWAIGALAHLRGEPPREYLDPDLWRDPTIWSDGTYFMDPYQGIQLFRHLVNYLSDHRLIEDSAR